MNRQRKILITVIYNDLGIIVDTKAEELDLSANLQQTCNKLAINLQRATDCISRQDAIDATWFEPSYTDPLNILTEVRDRLQALPSAQPEQRKGEWIDEGFYADGHGAHAFRCSECGGHIIEYDADPFCKWCGADMRGEQDGRFNQQTSGD